MPRSEKPRKKTNKPHRIGKIRQQQNELKDLVKHVDRELVPVVQNLGLLGDVVDHALTVSTADISEEKRTEIAEFVETTRKDVLQFADTIGASRANIYAEATRKVDRKNAEDKREFLVSGFNAISVISETTETLLGYQQRTAKQAKAYFEELGVKEEEIVPEVLKQIQQETESEQPE